MSKKLLLDSSSTKVIRSQIDYFGDIQKTDVTIAGSTVESILSYYPIDREENLIEFHINSSASQFIDLWNTNLFINCKVVKTDGSNLTAEDKIGCINLMLHSLIRDVEVSLNGTIIYSSNDCYAIRAYIQTHLGVGYNRKVTDLTSALYYPDTTTEIDFEKDGGMKTRKSYIDLSKSIELEGPLCIDICQQSKYIPPNTQVIIRMKRSLPEFVLLSKASTSSKTTTSSSQVCPYKIVFSQCRLKVLRHSLNSPFPENIERSLSSGKIGKMLMKRTEIKLHYIPTSVFSIIGENIFVGVIPEIIVIGLCPTETYSGKIDSNPYYMDHHEVSSVTVATDTETGIMNYQLSIDKTAGTFLEAFRSLLNLVPSLESGNGLNRQDYLKGNTFFSFHLQPRSLSSTVQQIQHGSVRIGLNFKSQVTKPLTAIIYAQYDAVLTFDADKNYKFL